MKNEQIREIALSCGFKLNDTTGETPDLRPYVYQFARKLISTAVEPALTVKRTTKECWHCGHKVMIELTSQNAKICNSCKKPTPWPLEPGQEKIL